MDGLCCGTRIVAVCIDLYYIWNLPHPLSLNHAVLPLSLYPENGHYSLSTALRAQKVIILPLRSHVRLSPFELCTSSLCLSPCFPCVVAPSSKHIFIPPFKTWLFVFLLFFITIFKEKREKKKLSPSRCYLSTSLTRDHLSAASGLRSPPSRHPYLANSGQMRCGALQGFTGRWDLQMRSEIREQ